MKKNALVISLVSIIGLSVYISNSIFVSKDKNTASQNNNSTLALYIENEGGEYKPSSDEYFPKEGYVLNLDKSSCKNGGILSQDPDTKTINLSASASDQCSVYFECERYATKTLANSLKVYGDTANTYNFCSRTEMYVFIHEATTQTPAQTDYRYIGNTPNNYVTFNGETWRIIGVFETENSAGKTEQRIKIVRQETLGDLAWNSNKSSEWSTASLKTLLNGDYYNRTGDYANSGLSEESRKMIDPAKWYLGGSGANPSTAQLAYSFERGEKTYKNSRTTNIIQNVGLIYPSDYIYTYANGVNEKCYTDAYNCNKGTPASGWIFNMFGGKVQWTTAPVTGYSDSVFFVGPTGYFNSNFNGSSGWANVTNAHGVHPVVYLKSSIKLVGGDGTQSNPYILG